MTQSSQEIAGPARDVRRKRLYYQSQHRGMKEMDLILGRFAEAQIDHLSQDQLDELERLLAQSDDLLYRWFSGREPVPATFDGDLFRRIRDWHAARQAP